MFSLVSSKFLAMRNITLYSVLVAVHTIQIRLKDVFFLSLLVDTKQRPILPNGVEIISLMIITGLFIGSNFP